MKKILLILGMIFWQTTAIANDVLFNRVFANIQSLAEIIPVDMMWAKSVQACKKNDAQACAVAGYLTWYYRHALSRHTVSSKGDAVLASLGLKNNEIVDELAIKQAKNYWYKAEEILQKSCAKNDVAACFNLIKISHIGYIHSDEEKLLPKTLKLAQKNCANHNGQACFIQIMLDENNFNSSDQQIIEQLKQSCELNYPDACYLAFLIQYDNHLENNEKIDKNGLSLLEKSSQAYLKEQAENAYEYAFVDIVNTCERLKMYQK